HHLKCHRIDDIARAVGYRMDGGNLGIAGTYVCGEIVERNEVLTHRTVLVGIENARVRIPDLAFRRRTQPAAVERTALVTAQFAEVSCALQGAGHTSVLGY